MKTLSVLTFGAVCSILAITVPARSVLAQVTISSAVTQSGFSGPQNGGPYQFTSVPYDFRNQDYNLLTIPIQEITVSLRIIDGDTAVNNYDFNNLTLGLDAIDTGIRLNGFTTTIDPTFSVRQAITATPINSQAILSALQADGQLIGTVIDSDFDGTDDISFPSSFTTTLEITGTPVPFEFSPGLGILALGLWGGMAQLKSKLQKQKSSVSGFSQN